MGKLHIYRAGWMRPTVIERDTPPTREEAKQILGNGCEYVELVSVLFKGKPAQMLVDEDFQAKDLPTNWDATDIYMAATRAGRSGAPKDSPTHFIQGTAIVMEGLRWD